MEDYLIREIDKMGVVIAAILHGVLHRRRDDDGACAFAMTELLDKASIDIDDLLKRDDMAECLVVEHGLTNDSLDKMVELLYQFVIASSDKSFTMGCIHAIGILCRYLDNHESTASFRRYTILKEVERFSR